MTDHIANFKKIKQIVSNGHVGMFILKTTSSLKPDKMRDLFRVTVDGELPQHFRDLARKKMDWLINDPDLSVVEFFSDSARDRIIWTLTDMEVIPVLPPVLARIKQGSHVPTIPSFNETALEKLQSYAIEIKNDKERIIYFRKYGKGSKISSTGLALLLKKGKFNKLDGDVFKFDNTIDCVYYEWDGQIGLYIINRDYFESIFSFYEVYKEESAAAQSILESSNLISITKGLFESIIEKRRYAKKIALINKKGNFDQIDLQKIQTLMVKAHNVFKFTIKDKKIIITDREALKDFLDVCEKHILADPFDENQLFRVKNMERLSEN